MLDLSASLFISDSEFSLCKELRASLFISDSEFSLCKELRASLDSHSLVNPLFPIIILYLWRSAALSCYESSTVIRANGRAVDY